MRRVAALLRAVNVGGRKLAMADLRTLLGEAGFEAAETLLASGNAVFAADADPPAVERRLEAALQAKLGLATQVLVRDGPELAAVLAANPFEAMATSEPNRLAVLFLRGAPQAELSVLAPYCTQREATAVGPGCLYVAYPAGMGVSKLALTVIERRLGVVGTARNWNTVRKLHERVLAG